MGDGVCEKATFVSNGAKSTTSTLSQRVQTPVLGTEEPSVVLEILHRFFVFLGRCTRAESA
jgi:hypothetical protein